MDSSFRATLRPNSQPTRTKVCRKAGHADCIRTLGGQTTDASFYFVVVFVYLQQFIKIYNFCHLLMFLFKASMVKLISLYCARVINVVD